MSCGTLAILWFLVVCISGAVIENYQLGNKHLVRHDVAASYHVKRSVGDNSTPEKQCLEDVEENSGDKRFSSLTPTVKRKRCPRERRLGASFHPTQNSKSSIPIERRDLLHHLQTSCDDCKQRRNCGDGPCQICDVFCKTLALLPGRRSSAIDATAGTKPIVQPKDTLPKRDAQHLGNRLGAPLETKPLIEPDETLAEQEPQFSEGGPDLRASNDDRSRNKFTDDDDVMIIGSANTNNEIIDNEQIVPLGPPSSSILENAQVQSDNQPFELGGRLGHTENVQQYPLATIDSGSVKELILQLLGIHNTTDIDKVIIYATTHSNQPPVQSKPSSSFPPFEHIASHLKEALQKALEKKIHEQGVNFMSNEEIDKLILDTLAQMRQEKSLSENVGSMNQLDDFAMPRNPAMPESIVVPQVANPSIIEGPPDMSELQEARMADDLEASPSDTKFNIVVPDEYLGWSKGGDTPTRIGLPSDNANGAGPVDDSLRDTSPNMAFQAVDEPEIKSVEGRRLQMPNSADHSIDATADDHVLREKLKDTGDKNRNGGLPSPQQTFDRMMNNFRNTWNQNSESNNENQLGEPEPTFKFNKLPKKPIIKFPKPFIKPFSKFRSSVIDENAIPTNDVIDETSKSNEPEPINPSVPQNDIVSKSADLTPEKTVIVKAIDAETLPVDEQKTWRSNANPEQNLSLKEMARNLIDDYNYGRKETIRSQPRANEVQNLNSNARESNAMMISENLDNGEAIENPANEFPSGGPAEDQIVFIEPDPELAAVNNENQIIWKGNNFVGSSNNNGGSDIAETLSNANMDNTASRSNFKNTDRSQLLNSGSSTLYQGGLSPTGRGADIQQQPNLVSTELRSNPEDNLSQPREENTKTLLDAGPFVSRGRELYNKYIADQKKINDPKNEGADGKLRASKPGDNLQQVEEKPFISRGRELYNKYVAERKKLDDMKNKAIGDSKLGAGESIGSEKDSEMGTSNAGNWQKETSDQKQRSGWSPTDSINDFDIAQKALGQIQELSEKLQQDTKLRKPFDQEKLGNFLTDLEPVAKEANKLIDHVKDASHSIKNTISDLSNKQLTTNAKEAVVGSQPLENSWENLQPTVPRFSQQIPEIKESFLGEPPITDRTSPISARNRAGFNDPSLAEGLDLKDQNDIALSLSNPKELYFVSNGDKLPLQITKSANGEIHLSVDVEKLCSCKNTSCPANHTLIGNTVSEILEKEAELKEELKPIVNDVLSGDNVEPVLGMQNSMINGGTPSLHSRSLFDSSSIESQGLDLGARNEREINDNKDNNGVDSDESLRQQSQNLDISRRSLEKRVENKENASNKNVVIQSDTQSGTLENPQSQMELVEVPTETAIPTQTILVGERTKLTPSRDPNYFSKLLSNLRLPIWGKPKDDQENVGFTTPNFLKSLFNFGTTKTPSTLSPTEATTVPLIGSRSKSIIDETKDIKMPISKEFKFNKLNNQLEKLEKIDKSVDNYVKENDKILEEEAKTILGSNQDPSVKQEVGIMSNILNWFKKLAIDRGKK